MPGRLGHCQAGLHPVASLGMDEPALIVLDGFRARTICVQSVLDQGHEVGVQVLGVEVALVGGGDVVSEVERAVERQLQLHRPHVRQLLLVTGESEEVVVNLRERVIPRPPPVHDWRRWATISGPVMLHPQLQSQKNSSRLRRGLMS